MNTMCVNVSGIANSQMKTSLKNALDKLDGVKTVDVDKTLGTVTVNFNEPTDETEIKTCIAETGFSLL